MKRLLTVLLLLTAAAFAQGVRIGDGTPVASTLNLSGVGNILTPSSTAAIAICTYPANAVPCTNKATTYTSQALSVACATSVQVTLPGTSSCVANADALGNWGAWVAPGSYDYTITVGARSYGPYSVTMGNVALVANSALKDATQDKAFLNVLNDCPGVVGGGFPQDDGPALNTCFAAHKGYHFRFPLIYLTRCTVGHGGGCVGVKDYYSSVPLMIQGNGVILEGEGNCKWDNGCTTVQFGVGSGGLVAFDAYGGAVRSLGLLGQNAWNSALLSSFLPPTTFSGAGADGILVTSAVFEVSNSAIQGFARDGINVMGDGSYPGQDANNQPDQFNFTGNIFRSNQGYAMHMHGGDSQAGLEANNQCYENQMGCVGDYSQTGNTHVADTSQGDGHATRFVAGTAQAVTSTTITAGTLAINTTLAPANGMQTVGNYLKLNGSTQSAPNTTAITSTAVKQGNMVFTLPIAPPVWITVGLWVFPLGQLDGTFDQNCIVTAIDTPGKKVTCALVNFVDGTGLHADGSTTGGNLVDSSDQICRITSVVGSVVSCATLNANMASTGGTVRTTSPNEVFEFYRGRYGFTVGSFVGTLYANQATYVNPYCESSSRFPYFGTGTLVLGRNQCETNLATNQNITWNAITTNAESMTIRPQQGVAMESKDDQTFNLDINPGRTASQVGQARWLDRGTVKFCISKATNNNIFLMEACSASNSQIVFNTGAGIDIIPKSGQQLRIVGGTQPVLFTGAGFTQKAAIDQNGLGTFNGGIQAGASGSTVADSRELVQNAHSCGTTTTCANTANGSNRIIFGTVALSSATPSTAVVSGITAFTSTSSYNCTLTNMTNAANNLLKVVNTSTSSFTITGPNTITDTISYICIGN